jgi:Uma2 family endonuclease
MSILTTSETQAYPRRHHWTRAQYERAIDAGLFGEDDHVELIEGEIVPKPDFLKPGHASGIIALYQELVAVFASGHVVRCQMPLGVGLNSEPEPDIALVKGTRRDYVKAHPTTAVLVVEVADSSLAYDRTYKASLYAKAGIQEYWILNPADRLLEVFREPVASPDGVFGYGYQSTVRYTESERVAPLAAPDSSVAVADLLP